MSPLRWVLGRLFPRRSLTPLELEKNSMAALSKILADVTALETRLTALSPLISAAIAGATGKAVAAVQAEVDAVDAVVVNLTKAVDAVVAAVPTT